MPAPARKTDDRRPRPEREAARRAAAPPQQLGSPPTGSGGAQRILTNTAYRAVADVGGKLASIVFYVVLAREAGEAAFGVFTFALSLVTLVTVLGNFGQDPILTREVARDRRRVDFYVANTVALKLSLALPLLGVFLVAASAFGMDGTTRAVTGLLGLAVVAEMLMTTCFATFQSYERLAFIPVALIGQRLLTAAVAIPALLLGVGLVAVACIYLAGAVFGLMVATTALWRHVVRPRIELELRAWPSLMAAAAWTGLGGVFAIVLSRVDAAMLAAYQSDAVVGNYGAAYRLMEATFFVTWSVGTAVFPVLSRLTRHTEPPVSLVFERALKLVIAVTLPLAAGAALLAGPLVGALYGSEYDEAGRALALLAPTIALYPVCYVAGALLVSQNRQHLTTVVYGTMAAQNILLNLVLIPRFSLYGAAFGTSLTQLLVAVGMLLFSRRLSRGVSWRRVLVGPVASTVLAASAMALLADHLVAAAAAGVTTYVVTIVVFERRAFPEDAREFLEFVRRAAPRSAARA